MPKPLYPAPIQDPLVGGLKVIGGSAWATWFDFVYRYLRGFSTTVDGDTSAQMNYTYIADSNLLLTLTLPEQLTVNDTIKVLGKGAGGWRIQLNSGQIIRGTSSTSSGGTLSSTNRYNTVILQVMTTDTELSVISQVGTLTYA